jgi:hypothetical protein
MSAGSHNNRDGMRSVGNIENCKSLHSLTLLRHVVCYLPEAIDRIDRRRSQGG